MKMTHLRLGQSLLLSLALVAAGCVTEPVTLLPKAQAEFRPANP